ARQLDKPAATFDELRNEAIAALALPDARLVKEWDGWPEGSFHLAFDAALEHYVRNDTRGNVTLHRVADGQVVDRLTGLPPTDSLLVLSPNARYVSICTTGRVTAWDLHTRPARRLVDEPGLTEGYFNPQSTQMAMVHQDGSLLIHDLPSGRLALRLALG